MAPVIDNSVVFQYLAGSQKRVFKFPIHYPDGVAFAVLLVGMTVPLIDHYTQPRIFGARAGDDGRV